MAHTFWHKVTGNVTQNVQDSAEAARAGLASYGKAFMNPIDTAQEQGSRFISNAKQAVTDTASLIPPQVTGGAGTAPGTGVNPVAPGTAAPTPEEKGIGGRFLEGAKGTFWGNLFLGDSDRRKRNDAAKSAKDTAELAKITAQADAAKQRAALTKKQVDQFATDNNLTADATKALTNLRNAQRETEEKHGDNVALQIARNGIRLATAESQEFVTGTTKNYNNALVASALTNFKANLKPDYIAEKAQTDSRLKENFRHYNLMNAFVQSRENEGDDAHVSHGLLEDFLEQGNYVLEDDMLWQDVYNSVTGEMERDPKPVFENLLDAQREIHADSLGIIQEIIWADEMNSTAETKYIGQAADGLGTAALVLRPRLDEDGNEVRGPSTPEHPDGEVINEEVYNNANRVENRKWLLDLIETLSPEEQNELTLLSYWDDYSDPELKTDAQRDIPQAILNKALAGEGYELDDSSPTGEIYIKRNGVKRRAEDVIADIREGTFYRAVNGRKRRLQQDAQRAYATAQGESADRIAKHQVVKVMPNGDIVSYRTDVPQDRRTYTVIHSNNDIADLWKRAATKPTGVMHEETGLTGQNLRDLVYMKTVVDGHTIEWDEEGFRHAIIWKDRKNRTLGISATDDFNVLGLTVQPVDGPPRKVPWQEDMQPKGGDWQATLLAEKLKQAEAKNKKLEARLKLLEQANSPQP